MRLVDDNGDKGAPDEPFVQALAAYERHVRSLALDRAKPPETRMIEIRGLLELDPTAGKELVREIASDPTERAEMLTLAGQQLAKLWWAHALSQFDTRDLTDIAGDIVDNATPDELWSWG